MTPNMYLKLRRSLLNHESYRKFPYTDTDGKITIGIGYNLTDRGIDDDWINAQYQKDVNYFYNKLSATFPWYNTLNEDRQIVLIDMCFMGWRHFLEFNKLIEALSEGDFKKAAFEILNSEYHQETKNRAAVLAQGILTGVYNV